VEQVIPLRLPPLQIQMQLKVVLGVIAFLVLLLLMVRLIMAPVEVVVRQLLE
jgi:hypothetical protein